MELQLGLGLPSNGGSYELDLNRQFHENGEGFDGGRRSRGHADGQRFVFVDFLKDLILDVKLEDFQVFKDTLFKFNGVLFLYK